MSHGAFVNLLDAIADPERARIDAHDVAMVTAHPDDETLAFGALMPRLTGVRLVVVTDGSPRDLITAHALGLGSVKAYADARQTELLAALELAGVPASALTRLEVPDKEAAMNLAAVAARLHAFFAANAIRAVLTHAFEGGHPDHDAVAAAVALATRGSAVEVVEAPFYSLQQGRYSVHRFAPADGRPVVETPLTPAEAALKRQMLDAFTTQAPIFEGYRPRVERFRHAPAYDFTQPPNGGVIWYERDFFPWATWREATADALAAASGE
jgi:LmbE family N-acetylglucosaminyl deacetylase